MERFGQSQRQQRSFEGSESARRSCWDVDFSDVFGGPPRRYSMQEVKMRYSFSETTLEELEDVDDNTAATTSWSGLNEKPVFGGESVNRRRYVNDGFFDDIFKADEAHCSPGRRLERDPLGSAPGSRVPSPAWPLPPPKAEPFGTSLPAQFSLPAKLTTAMDYPATSPEKGKEGASNGISNLRISKASFAKFLNRPINGKREAKADRQSYRQSPLSREVSLTSEESPHLVLPDGKGKGSPLKEGTGNDGSQFHFSIYKWAGGGVPLMMPLRAGNSPIERSSSSNGRIECDNLDNETGGKPASAHDQSVSSNGVLKSLKVGMEKGNKQNNGKGTESRGTKNDVDVEVLESDVFDGLDKPAVVSKAKLNNRDVLQSSVREEKHEKTKKEVHTKESRSSRPGTRPLSELLTQKLDAQGKKEENESVINSSRAAKSVPISNKEKKNDARIKTSNKVPSQKDGSPGSPSTTGNIPAKTGVKGKVREFAKIFNHETIGKTKINPHTRSQSSRWKNTDRRGLESGGSNVQDIYEKMPSTREDIKSNDIPKDGENPFKDKVKQPSSMKTSSHGSNRNTDKRDASSSRESFGGTYKVSSGNTEDIFQESFVVEELSHQEDKRVETGGDSEDKKASDAKIQQWAHGRKGNIRSLLSTLQYVLWAESGWKPIALVDIIEATAVKRSYQRALLWLHPDKLQQKDASSHQKYIAEKVFDILQEAWDHFNSVGGI